MSDFTTKWTISLLTDKLLSGVKSVTENLKKATTAGSGLGDCLKKINAIDLFAISQSISSLKDGLGSLSDLAIQNEKALAEVSAITGTTGDALDSLNDKAKNLAKTYGEDVNQNLDTFKTILSRLGPDIGKSDKAMEMFGESVNVLSKTMEGDITGATDAITTSMLQFQVDLSNPVKAAEESRRMINVMAAGAKEGAAEIPQIGEALVQAGVSAKLANLSFEETNAAVQAMAEGGKYGAEAGTAIRNVITNMSASTKITDTASVILKAYGVNMKKMADTSVPWADRLRELKPIQHDINALTELFGRENAAAGQILIRSADSQEELTKKITGTNVAYEQASIIMDTDFEKQKRRNQEWDLFKMKIGEVTKQYQPYINVTAQSMVVMANMKNAYDGLKIVMNGIRIALGLDTLAKFFNERITKKLTRENLRLSFTSTAVGLAMAGASAPTFGFAVALGAVKLAVNSLSTAIMSIPLVGWILAIIAALIAVFSWLWNNVGEFRGFFYGLWEVIKLVFSGIWQTIKFIVAMIVAYFQWWWENAKTVFNGIKTVIGNAWNWVAQKFTWAWQTISTIVGGIWQSIKSTFSGVYDFFKSVFEPVFDFVSDIFDKIWNKIKGFMDFLKPLASALGGLWDKVKSAFGKGMKDGVKEVGDEKRNEAIEKGLANGSLVQYNGKVITKKRYDAIMAKQNAALGDPTGTVTQPVKTLDYDKLFGGDDKTKKKEKKKKGAHAGGSEDGVSMSGAKGNRTITMSLVINNNFSVSKGIGSVENIANKITGAINDRLRDGLVALD